MNDIIIDIMNDNTLVACVGGILLLWTTIVAIFTLKVKGTTIEIEAQPHILLIATRIINVSEELLLDYNDRESALPFLKECPVCMNLPLTGASVDTREVN